LVSFEIWKLIRNPIPDIISNNTIRQNMTAIPLGTFLSSIHLQRGKNKVANTVPTANGIRNPRAKYKPAIRRNKSRSFFSAEAELIVINREFS
jgi:hypothetical protein